MARPTSAGLEPANLARPAPGSVAPPRPLTARTALPVGFIRLDRGAGGMRVVDRGRFAAAGVLFTAELFSGALEPLGAIATINRAAASHPDYVVPDPWPAFTYGPSQMAVSDANDTRKARHPSHAAGRRDPPPQTELVVVNRSGRSLLVYLPGWPAPSRRGGLPGRRRRQHLVPPRRGRHAHKSSTMPPHWRG